MPERIIDVNTDFTLDTPNYWDSFWDVQDGIGVGGGDPDSLSKKLQSSHRTVWSRKLPCGETMALKKGTGPNYLTWKDFRFGSDSIIVSFRYEKYRYMLNEVEKAVPDYKAFVEDFLHRAYTIGGMMIFPKHTGSINQAKGTNPKIRDRWDLTLECIRRYYNNEESPMGNTLEKDKAFFDLFVDFKGFVDFFFLQDCVSPDCTSVNIWIGNADFTDDPLPKNVDEYLRWIDCQMTFLNRRNSRIASAFEL